MYRLLALFVVGCGLYTGSQPSQDEPSETSYITYKDLPVQEWRHPVDLVFVIDTTPEMAPLHDKLVAQFAKLADFIETAAVTMDLQIMVIDADVASSNASHPLHMLSLPTGGYDRSYSRSLSEELAALVPTTYTASSNQPLAALLAALGSDPAFRHDGTQVMPVIITNHDDGSPDSVDSYFTQLRALGSPWPLEPMIGLVDAPEAARLEQFFESQAEPYDHANIADDDWSVVLRSFEVKTTLGLPCIDAKLVEPFDCAFSATTGARETVLPTCDASATNRPCYQLAPHEGCVEGSRVYVKVSWLAWPEYGTHVTGQCVAETPSN